MSDDPRSELDRLAHSLRSRIESRVRLGIRRAPRASEPSPKPATAARPPIAEVPQPEASVPTPPAPAQAAPGGRFESTLAPPPQGPGATAGVNDGALAAIAERAAGCADLASLRTAVAGCEACTLCQTRTQTVFADGNGSAGVLFVGEAPGFHEDQQGVPFVGRAGELLGDIIEKGMGLRRADVYICNVLKCRPPENRDPSAAEKALCTAWLDRQIELLDPRVIIPLGRHAAGHLLKSEATMGRMRGRVHEVRGRKVVPTYHPAYLLRSPGMKRECWKDIQLAMKELGLPPPGG